MFDHFPRHQYLQIPLSLARSGQMRYPGGKCSRLIVDKNNVMCTPKTGSQLPHPTTGTFILILKKKDLN